jgi:hypothetical protein
VFTARYGLPLNPVLVTKELRADIGAVNVRLMVGKVAMDKCVR